MEKNMKEFFLHPQNSLSLLIGPRSLQELIRNKKKVIKMNSYDVTVQNISHYASSLEQLFLSNKKKN